MPICISVLATCLAFAQPLPTPTPRLVAKKKVKQNSTEPSKPVPSSQVQQVQPSTAKSVNDTPPHAAPTRGRNRLLLTLKDQSFLNRDQPPVGYTDYTTVGANLRTSSEGEHLSGAIEAGGIFSTNVDRYSTFEVPEAYLDWRFEFPDSDAGGGSLVAGRRKDVWSRLDLDWDLGLTEPLNRFDGLRVTEQGLTGAFLSLQNGSFEAVMYASPFFLPEQGAPYFLENGAFKTPSPWFSLPPDNLVINGVHTPAQYSLDTPSIGSVVNHAGAGFILRYGHPRESGIFAQVSYLRKPRNTFELPFTGVLKIEDAKSYGAIGVFPQILYHSISAVDTGYNSRAWSVGLSGLVETVDDLNLDPKLTYQKYDPLQVVSPSAEVRFFPSKFWGPRVKVARLFTLNGDVLAVGPNGSNGQVFGARENWRQAFSMTISSRLVSMGSFRVDQTFRWIQEVEERGTILSADIKFLIGEKWRVLLSGDLLSSELPADDTSTFIGRFRGNDRVSLGLTYVF